MWCASSGRTLAVRLHTHVRGQTLYASGSGRRLQSQDSNALQELIESINEDLLGGPNRRTEVKKPNNISSELQYGFIDEEKRQKWTGSKWAPLCSNPGCTSAARSGSTECFAHKMLLPKSCSVEGCNNSNVKAGFCTKHSPKKECSVDGCTNLAMVKSAKGYCVKHKRGPFSGCEQPVGSNGVHCKLHRPKKQCSVASCTNQAIKGGVCTVHGATRKKCKIEGCMNGFVKDGLCKIHGGILSAKICSYPDCASTAIKAGMCMKHAPDMNCRIPGCRRKRQHGAFCLVHSGRKNTTKSSLAQLFGSLFGTSQRYKNRKLPQFELILGCPVPFFYEYIRSKCEPGMEETNYGTRSANQPNYPGIPKGARLNPEERRWEIDWIKPMVLYYYEKAERYEKMKEQGLSDDEIEKEEKEKLKEMSHYTNFAPIWRDINRRKNEYWTLVRMRKQYEPGKE